MDLSKPQFVFYQPEVALSDFLSKELFETSYTVALPYGSLTFRQWAFDGIKITHKTSAYLGHYVLQNTNNENLVCLEFNLKGNFHIFHAGIHYEAKARQHNIIYTPNVDNTFHNLDLEAESLLIQFQPVVFHKITEDGNEVLRRFAEKMLVGKPIVLSPQSPYLNLELENAIQDLLQCPYQGGLKKLFLFSKCIEILVLQAEAMERIEKEVPIFLKNSGDKDRIIHAKDYLEQHLENPPSLSELSRIAGLNEYKFKKGFKEMFQTTAFGYLSDYRLSIAKQFLAQGQKSINELSYELGYSSPQHFSKAFKKKYGIPPKMAK